MDWWKWALLGLVVFIVLVVIFHFINKAFKERYGVSLYGGGLTMLIAIGGIVGGWLLFSGSTKLLGVVLLIIGVAALLFTLIYDIKKMGGVGIGALFLQTIFCIPTLVVILDLIFNKGRSTIFNYKYDMERRRRDRRKAMRDQRRDYYDRDYYDRY